MSAALFISLNTIRTYKTRLINKLN
ncbi:MAG: hypothetical protein CO127_01725 [Ignavibacteria bacterium CG_4_9_14_3_um_filter_36_18]|nr:MAG: hypothetical protein CO127_01725 [Ignavibacteria bacterium CG_4_9_14_3_um_filter_36_18]